MKKDRKLTDEGLLWVLNNKWFENDPLYLTAHDCILKPKHEIKGISQQHSQKMWNISWLVHQNSVTNIVSAGCHGDSLPSFKRLLFNVKRTFELWWQNLTNRRNEGFFFTTRRSYCSFFILIWTASLYILSFLPNLIFIKFMLHVYLKNETFRMCKWNT